MGGGGEIDSFIGRTNEDTLPTEIDDLTSKTLRSRFLKTLDDLMEPIGAIDSGARSISMERAMERCSKLEGSNENRMGCGDF